MQIGLVCLQIFNCVESFPLSSQIHSLSFDTIRRVFNGIDSLLSEIGKNVTILENQLAKSITFDSTTLPEKEISSETNFNELQEALCEFQVVLDNCIRFLPHEYQRVNNSKAHISRVVAGLESMDAIYYRTHKMVANYIAFQTTRLDELSKVMWKCSVENSNTKNGCNNMALKQVQLLENVELTMKVTNSYLDIIKDSKFLTEIKSQQPQNDNFHDPTDIIRLLEEESLEDLSCVTLIFKLLLLFGATSFATPLICFWTGYLKNGSRICEKWAVNITFKEFYIIMELVRRIKA